MNDAHTPEDTEDIVHEDVDVAYDDEGNELASEAKVKKLRDANKALVTENRTLLDTLQRTRADVVNRDKAAAEAQARVKDMVKEGMLEDLLPVLDAFSLAMGGTAWQAVEPTWRAGVEYIHAQLLKALEDNGITAYGKAGDAYDPQLHDLAEDVTPSEGAKITAVVRAGYKLSGKVLRAAGVKVG